VSTDNPSVTLTREQVLRLLDGNRVQLPTSLGMIELKSVPTPRWQKLRQVELSENVKQQKWREESPDSVWHNDQYEILVYGEGDGSMHLSIKRFDRAPIRNWRHFQQMKNEIAGPEREGLELFPRESRLADNANQYHLWVLPEGMEIPVGWQQGMVVIRDEEVEMYNHQPHPGRQEPLQRGLTVGRKLDNARTPIQDAQIKEILS
jgi:hypothetical protein